MPSCRRFRARLSTGLRSAGPRHLQSARVWATVIVVAADVTSFASAVFGEGGPRAIDVASAVLLAAVAAGLVVLPAPQAAFLCVLTPIIGGVAIVVLDLGSGDATVTGQIFFSLPVLYAATQRRVAGAVAATAGAVAGEAVVVLGLLPPGRAITEPAYVGTTPP